MSEARRLSLQAAASDYGTELPVDWGTMATADQLSWLAGQCAHDQTPESLLALIEARADAVEATLREALQFMQGDQYEGSNDSAELVSMAGLI